MIGIVMIRISALVLTLGMIAGMAMGMAQDFALAPAHAHLNLVGGVLMFMFGLYYRLIPGADAGLLPRVQAALHIIGAILFPAGIALVLLKGPGLEIVPIAGGIVVVLATLLFVMVVFRRQVA